MISIGTGVFSLIWRISFELSSILLNQLSLSQLSPACSTRRASSTTSLFARRIEPCDAALPIEFERIRAMYRIGRLEH